MIAECPLGPTQIEFTNCFPKPSLSTPLLERHVIVIMSVRQIFWGWRIPQDIKLMIFISYILFDLDIYHLQQNRNICPRHWWF
jgi:hypothetical protein